MDNIVPLNRADIKSQDLKKKLLECLDRESRQFSEIARSYFNKEQLSVEDKTGLLRAVIETVNHVMSAGDWDSSLFLRNTLKPLMQIKGEAELELNKLTAKAEENVVAMQGVGVDEMEVYISLFQSDGYNIGKWAMQLRSLERYIVGRPVYKTEEDMGKRLKLRAAAAANEAYVAVIVKKTDVNPEGPSPLKDQFGHPLVTLKEVALKNGRILAFVHQDVRYRYIDGQLVK